MIRIIIPVYNEEKNIQSCIEDIAEAISGNDYLVYAVNDGSYDKTSDILFKLSQKFPIKVISHKENRGVSAALKSGIVKVVKECGKDDVLVVMEGDGTSNPSLLPKMVESIQKGSSVVVASRYQKGGGYKSFPLGRLIHSQIANFIFRLLYPFEGISDYTIFYRAYNPEIVRKAYQDYKGSFPNFRYFVANTEILIKLFPYIVKASEIPFVYDYGLKKGRSGLNISKNIFEYLMFLLKTKMPKRK